MGWVGVAQRLGNCVGGSHFCIHGLGSRFAIFLSRAGHLGAGMFGCRHLCERRHGTVIKVTSISGKHYFHQSNFYFRQHHFHPEKISLLRMFCIDPAYFRSSKQHSPSLGDLPPGRSECPTTPFFSMLCLFLEFPVSVLHHPVHELLSRPSSSSLLLHPSLHYLSLYI